MHRFHTIIRLDSHILYILLPSTIKCGISALISRYKKGLIIVSSPCFLFGARNGSRTRTLSQVTDFESIAYTNFAIRAKEINSFVDYYIYNSLKKKSISIYILIYLCLRALRLILQLQPPQHHQKLKTTSSGNLFEVFRLRLLKQS